MGSLWILVNKEPKFIEYLRCSVDLGASTLCSSLAFASGLKCIDAAARRVYEVADSLSVKHDSNGTAPHCIGAKAVTALDSSFV